MQAVASLTAAMAVLATFVEPRCFQSAYLAYVLCVKRAIGITETGPFIYNPSRLGLVCCDNRGEIFELFGKLYGINFASLPYLWLC